MMSKQNYVRAAKLISTAVFDTVDDRDRAIALFNAFFSEDNPRYDSSRFWTACGYGEPDKHYLSTPAQETSFDAWMELVDRAVQKRTGLSIHDLEDQPFADWYEDGISPDAAARRTVTYSSERWPTRRKDLRMTDEQTWTTEQLREDFEVLGFMAPFVVVIRRSDGQKGSLMFNHSPRLYFSFQPHQEEG